MAQTYTLEDVWEAMGGPTTEVEAEAMYEILEERGIKSLDEIGDSEFFALIPEAIRRGQEKTAEMGAEPSTVED